VGSNNNIAVAKAVSQTSSRSFLFLQGVASPFFAQLADHLRMQGHAVHKVNFNAGDVAYWGRRPADLFRGRLEEWPAYLEDIYHRHGITDQLVFGDCRPLHVEAIALARRWDIRNHVCEEGYFRPFWFTMEREGVNMHSLLPRNPDWFREVGPRLKTVDTALPFTSPFSVRAAHDVAYHVAGALNPLVVPYYRTHATMNAVQEYYGYARRLPMLRVYAAGDTRKIKEVVKCRKPFFFLPLQLNSDAQIRTHSAFGNMVNVLRFVLASFAQHAPGDARLVIKNHPLDMWEVDYGKVLRELEVEFGLAGRIVYLETGALPPLLRHARGVITVNSTVGTLALTFKKPVIALGQALYNMDGLVYQGSLDQFWTDHPAPDAQLVESFRKVVIHVTQLNGGLHNAAGIKLAVPNAARVMTALYSPLEELLLRYDLFPNPS